MRTTNHIFRNAAVAWLGVLLTISMSMAETAPFAVQVSGKGPAMILIPGLSCGGNVWDGTVAHFKDHYECHVLTLAGFGGQPAIDGPFLDPVRAAIIKYIADKKLNHPVIIGHSLGGMLSYWIAATAPDAVGPVIAVDGLPFYSALINPAATGESMKEMAGRYRGQLASQPHDQFVSANRAFLQAMITSPEDLDRVAALSQNSDPKTVGTAFYELMTLDLRPQLKSIKSPVLLLGAAAMGTDAGMQATFEAAYRAQLTNAPNHKVVFVPGAKHFIQLDQPKAFYAEVEKFLKDSATAQH